PFGFPTSRNFQYAYSHQANLTVERNLGHNLSLGLEYNYNGGRHLNRPINANAVRSQALIQNYNIAVAAGAVPSNPPNPIGPLTLGSGPEGPCSTDPNFPWVSAALVSFFRPSGVNPSLATFLNAVGAGGWISLADAVLSGKGLNASCRPTGGSLGGCIPVRVMAAHFSKGASVYHGSEAYLVQRFG